MTSRRLIVVSCVALAVAGCAAPKSSAPAAKKETAPQGERLVPYIPASRPADPVTEQFPNAPRDARRAIPMGFTVEILEILLPRDSVSRDDAFWKRVDEPAGPAAEQLMKNGIRVGQLPINELETVRKLVEDRSSKRTSYTGISGRQLEIPIRPDVAEQTVFFRNRDDELVGRSWDRCDNVMFFSFETTPRNPDTVRLALTPGVRAREKKLQYAIVPGKPDRELKTVVEESNYDVTVQADLPLDRMLVIAPSTVAESPMSIGGTFLVDDKPSQRRERLIVIIPHAFTREGTPTE